MTLATSLRVVLLLFVATAACLGAPGRALAQDATGEDDAAWARVDSFAAAVVARDGLPGLALAVTDRTGVVHEVYVGMADVKLRRPVTDTTLFQIGSISKSITALALMRQVERGRLDPDRPVTDYLPWFSVHTDYQPIRVHHLLTHSAGIPSNRDDMHGGPFQARALRDQHTAWPPGDRFLYSNVGYQVLSVLLERLGGASYGDIIRRDVLEPAGMTHAEPVITLESRTRQAVGYVPPYDDRPHVRSRGLVEAPHFAYDVGDGPVQATARDLAAYGRLWLNRGVGPGGRVVSESSFRRFSTGHVEDGRSRYGYGVGVVEIDGRTHLSHTGGMVGFAAALLADTTAGLAAGSLVNGPSTGRSVALFALRVARALQDGDPVPSAPTGPAPPDARSAADFEGSFGSASGDSLHFTARDGHLNLATAASSQRLLPVGENTFLVPHAPHDRYPFVFERDSTDRVVAVHHGASRWFAASWSGPRTFDVPAAWTPVIGRYRSWSPWLPYFEVYEREGRLWLVTGEGGESSSGETELFELAPAIFRIGEAPTPERLSFHEMLEGKALSADWSGHVFYRVAR